MCHSTLVASETSLARSVSCLCERACGLPVKQHGAALLKDTSLLEKFSFPSLQFRVQTHLIGLISSNDIDFTD